MDFPILFIWTIPLSFLGPPGVILNFYFIFEEKYKIINANRMAPDGTPRFAASHLGILSLPMSNKKETRLIWVKDNPVMVL